MAWVQAEMPFRNYPGLGGELYPSFHLQLTRLSGFEGVANHKSLLINGYP